MIKIAVTGPESSGKTTLCKSLSEHFKTPYITEFSRTYLENKNGYYNQYDIDRIAKGQLKLISNEEEKKIMIYDSDFIVLQIWSKYKFGNTTKLIDKLVKKNLFDLHILCTPDMPWEEDPLRENKYDRDYLFKLYKESLNRYKKHYITVSGLHQNRLEKSIDKINSLLIF